MIDKEYTSKFVDKLISLTAQHKISWMTLPRYFESNDNEPLRKAVIANNQYAYSPFAAKKVFLMNEYRSYCATLNGGIIALFYRSREEDTTLDMSIQTNPAHCLTPLASDDDTSKKLEELMLEISASVDDGMKYISDIIKL